MRTESNYRFCAQRQGDAYPEQTAIAPELSRAAKRRGFVSLGPVRVDVINLLVETVEHIDQQLHFFMCQRLQKATLSFFCHIEDLIMQMLALCGEAEGVSPRVYRINLRLHITCVLQNLNRFAHRTLVQSDYLAYPLRRNVVLHSQHGQHTPLDDAYIEILSVDL